MKTIKYIASKVNTLINRVLSYNIPEWFLIILCSLGCIEIGILYTLMYQAIKQ